MKDWIDREKAIEDLQNGDPSQLYDVEDIKYWLNCLPSAQPDIIRCKECKWWGRKDIYKDGTEMIVCKKGRSVIPEGFCHHAELRGEQDGND